MTKQKILESSREAWLPRVPQSHKGPTAQGNKLSRNALFQDGEPVAEPQDEGACQEDTAHVQERET